jgi:hypothetical protein
MELTQIFLSILDKPEVPRFYRELQTYYQKSNMSEEAQAIGFLVEKKFEKKNEVSSDN